MMENLTFKNFQDYVTKSIVTKAKKLPARDSEEITPNKIIAYVDEGKNTYDVAIEFEKDKIKNLSCDCEKGFSFCVHKIALINLVKNKKPEEAISTKRKKAESEIILQELDESSLRIWVQELFKKNKDFELLFVNEFSKTEIVFDKNEIKTIIDKAIKSVIKNKKSVDATELKRIIDILDFSLQPVLKYCKNQIGLPITNELLIDVYSELLEFNYKKNVSGVKMIRFVEKLYKEINHFIHNIKDSEQWEFVVKEIIHYIFYKKKAYELEIEIIYHLYESIDNKEKKQFFARVFFDLFTISVNNKERFVRSVNQFFLLVFSENNLFNKLYQHFQPMRYENEYNILLIEKLIEIEKLELAENIAKEQISVNSNDKYNIPYYNLLKKIYTISKDEKKIAFLQMKTIFYDYSLENYLLVQKYSAEKEFKIFRTKLLTSFKRNFYISPKAVAAYFEIFYYDKKYKNIIDNISEYTSYEMIYRYREELFLFDKLSFLTALANIDKNSYFSFKKGNLHVEYRDKFIIWIKEKYDKIMIDTVIKNKKQYYHSTFLHELENY